MSPQPIKIPCTIVMTPGNASRQPHFRIEVGSMVVWEGFERDLPVPWKHAIKEIIANYAVDVQRLGKGISA